MSLGLLLTDVGVMNMFRLILNNDSPQVKKNLIYSKRYFIHIYMYELRHKLQNDLT